MKKIFYFLIFLSLFSGCSDDKKDNMYPDYEQRVNDDDDSVAVDEENPVPDSDSGGGKDDGDVNSDSDEDGFDDRNDEESDESSESDIPDWENDICNPNPCIMENSDGICTPFNDSFKCGCVEDHYWINGACVEDPCLDNPCDADENSTGECLVDGNGYLCVCDDNFFWEKDSCKPVPGIVFVKADATGNNDGTSWANAFTDLTDALESVGNPAEKKWLWVAEGIYRPKKKMNIFNCGDSQRYNNFAMKNNVSIICGFSGNESKVEQRDHSENETIFSGDLDEDGKFSEGDSYHVFFNYNNDETAVIDGCIIEGGNADYDDGDIYDLHMKHGGGMNNLNEFYAVIRNVVFRNNKGKVMGGAVANSNSSSPLIENCTFENNLAFRGGAIGNSMSSPKIISTLFKNNSTNEGYGGAIFNNDNSSPVIEDSVFENNTSSDGGAIVNMEYSGPQIVRSVFRNNIASRTGGAISSGYNSDPEIINSVFESNSSQMGGGAVEIYQDSFPRIVNSKFLFNKTGEEYFGGGILVSTSSIDIINSLFAGNQANSGGGIATRWSVVNLVNSTVALNLAKGENCYGGGMYNTGTNGEIYVTNTIIYNNFSDTFDNEISNDLTLTNVDHSNIRGCFNSGSWNSLCGEDKGYNIDIDPLFNDMNKGDFTLSADSPCIDSGDSSPFETDGVAEGIFKDLLGNDRIINDKIDMGAYENVR